MLEKNDTVIQQFASKMADPLYDVIVVGAGVEGSGAAYQLSKRGVRVLLLEQFPLPHSRGSSHGASRIIRRANFSEIYSQMANYSLDEWKRIGQEAGATVYKNSGYLNIGNLSDKAILDDIQAMDLTNAPYHILTPQKFRERFPHLKYDDDVGAVFDVEGGTLYADKCLQSLQKLFIKQGGILKDSERLESIHPGEAIRVVTSKQTYTGRSLILCCGPWTNKVLKDLDLQLPLEPIKINVCYWPEKVPGSYSCDHTPTIAEEMERSVTYPYLTYGLPSDEYPGHFKFCLHSGPSVDPETRDAGDSQWVFNLLKVYVQDHFPGLVPKPSIVESCMYTLTPDREFIIDSHPKWKNIVIGAGFSGHGFKHAPAIGNILADLAQGKTPEYDIGCFRIGRFRTKAHSKL